jgi:hypothetical protein
VATVSVDSQYNFINVQSAVPGMKYVDGHANNIWSLHITQISWHVYGWEV